MRAAWECATEIALVDSPCWLPFACAEGSLRDLLGARRERRPYVTFAQIEQPAASHPTILGPLPLETGDGKDEGGAGRPGAEQRSPAGAAGEREPHLAVSFLSPRPPMSPSRAPRQAPQRRSARVPRQDTDWAESFDSTGVLQYGSAVDLLPFSP